MKRKKNKIFLTFQSGDLNPRFSVIFMESEEPKRSNQKKLLKEIGLCIIFWHINAKLSVKYILMFEVILLI